MAVRQLPDAETLRKLLRYDPETGKLYWLPRSAGMIPDSSHLMSAARCEAWNRRYAGKEAITAVDTDGYLMGSVLCRPVKAHRVAWAIFYGEWPAQNIDHRNLIPNDNRISNLRLSTKSQNSHNTLPSKKNTSGVKGVSWEKLRGKWLARICVHGRQRNLGRFETLEEARIAYSKSAKAFCGEFARTD